MKIRYIHSSDPETEKILDTEKSLKGSGGILHTMGFNPSQEEWDEHELNRFEQDKEKGLILSYSIATGQDGPIGDSRFEQLCKDFNLRHPAEPPAKRTFWFASSWKYKAASVNDLLRKFLIKNGMKYLNTFNGDVWFIRNGDWCRCDYEVSGSTVRFYVCEFTRNPIL